MFFFLWNDNHFFPLNLGLVPLSFCFSPSSFSFQFCFTSLIQLIVQFHCSGTFDHCKMFECDTACDLYIYGNKLKGSTDFQCALVKSVCSKTMWCHFDFGAILRKFACPLSELAMIRISIAFSIDYDLPLEKSAESLARERWEKIWGVTRTLYEVLLVIHSPFMW